MRFNGNDLENGQRLDELLGSLFEDGARVDVPGGTLQVQTVREATYQHTSLSPVSTGVYLATP